MAERWTCERHSTEQVGPVPCPPCQQAFENRLPASELTGDERAAILQQLAAQVTIAFSDLHRWVEELVGRPVWTHEMGDWEALVEEARTQEHIGIEEVIAKLPWDKPVLLIDADTGQSEYLP
jgi:hypothetical protein